MSFSHFLKKSPLAEEISRTDVVTLSGYRRSGWTRKFSVALGHAAWPLLGERANGQTQSFNSLTSCSIVLDLAHAAHSAITFADIYVTLHKKTRHKSQFAICHNAHIKVKSLFCFLLKLKFINQDKIKSV